MRIVILLLLGLYCQNTFGQWARLNSGTEQELNAIFFTDEKNGYTCGSNGYVGKTTNGGSSWEDISISKPFTLHDLFFLDSMRGYVVGLNALIYKTIDGGKSWTEDRPISGETVLKSISFRDTGYGVAVGEEGKIFIYENGAWRKQSLNDRVDLNDVAIDTSGLAVIAADSGKIYVKKKIDNSFTAYSGYSSTTPFTSIQFIENLIYVTGGWYDDSLQNFTWHFLESKDNGQFFSENSTMDLEVMNRTYFVSKNKGYYLGKSTGFYASEDKLASNYRLLPGTNNTLNNFHFIDSNIVFACGVAGTIVKTNHSPGWNTSITEANEGFGFYPNPAQNFIWIDKPNEIKHISVYDLQGTLVLHENTVNKMLPILGLRKGLYHTLVTKKDGTVCSYKLIKD